MKKMRFLFIALVAVLCVALVACKTNNDDNGDDDFVDYTGSEVQGVTDTEILVGNTAATTGAFAVVGQPFNAAIECVFADYNAAGGFNGKTVRLVHYDDGFDGAKGLAYTTQLVEEDKIFALVGHFGTNTVTQTIDYIKEKGIPMVYAATGISGLYQEGAKGYNRAVMSVQPIFDAEGRVLLARAVASTEGGWGLGATKVGVISTTDDAGTGMLAGIKRQAQELKVSIVYATTAADQGTDHSAAINKLKSAGCDVVIIAANQTPCTEILNYMRDASYSAKVITSYVSANTTTLGSLVDSGAITAERPVYTTAWLDVTDNAVSHTAYYAVSYTDPADVSTYVYTLAVPSDDVKAVIDATKNEYGFGFDASYNMYFVQESAAYSQAYWDYAECVTRNGHPEYMANSYGMAGYIAAKIFIQGLERLQAAGKALTWKNYVDIMEQGILDLPMGGTINYANGNRFGVTDLALNTISLDKDPQTAAYYLIAVSPISTLDEVMAQVPSKYLK